MDIKVAPTVTQKTVQKGIGIDILWSLVIISGFLFFVSLIPMPPNDFWWHLRIGELISSNHTIPATNIFSWTIPVDQPYYYAAWLAEYLFYILYRLGSLDLLIFLRTILIGIPIVLVAKEARRRSNSWRIAAFVVALLSLMITNNLPVRTQIFAWLPFVTTYIVLKRFAEQKLSWRWLILCPLAMLVWVNVHGSFILGLVLIGAFFVGEIASRLLKQFTSLTWQQVGMIGGTGILSSLAVLINPRFTGIISYTIKLLTDPSSQKLIEEWQSPTPRGLANVTFYASILIFIIVLAYSKYRLSPTEVLLFSGFLWLAWSGQRYVIWYAVITTPILARLISELPLKIPAFIPQRNWLNLVLAGLIFIPVLIVQPWFVEQVPLPPTYWRQVLRGSPAGPLISVNTPVAAADYLKSHPGGNLFNEMGYGSYLIWALPDLKVFVDTRVELYPYQQWLDYININRGIDYNELFQAYGVDRLLLDKELQSALIARLIKDDIWTLEYDDQYSQIWSRARLP